MFSLSLSPSDLSTKLIHAYCISLGDKLSIESSTVEQSAVTLQDGQTLQGTNTLAVHLATHSNSDLMGAEADAPEIHQWLTFSAKTQGGHELAKALNEHLLTRTYLVANHLSVADLVAFVRVHSIFSALSASQRFDLPALTRWFDLVQHSTPGVEGLAMIEVDLKAPKIVKIVETKEAKAAKKAAGKENVEAKENVAKESDKKAGKEDKKSAKKAEKGEKKAGKKEAPAAPAPPAGAVDGCVPSQLDLRVGKIVHCEKHPGADSLYVEKIDAGEEEPRTVVSGLVNHIPLELMMNREVIIMANLKPVAMRGVKSMAMVMCTTTAEGIVDILPPPKGSKPGDRVYFEGYEDLVPETQLNPKKKIFETLSPTLKTDESGKARWIDADGKSHLMRTEQGVCQNAAAVDSLIK